MVRRRQSRRAPHAITGSEGTVGRERVLVNVDHDLEALAAGASSGVAGEVTLRDCDHGVGARRPRGGRFRGIIGVGVIARGGFRGFSSDVERAAEVTAMLWPARGRS